jgi:hypothetical protein
MPYGYNPKRYIPWPLWSSNICRIKIRVKSKDKVSRANGRGEGVGRRGVSVNDESTSGK